MNRIELVEKIGGSLAKRVLGMVPKGSTILLAEMVDWKRTGQMSNYRNLEVIYSVDGFVRKTIIAGKNGRRCSWYK